MSYTPGLSRAVADEPCDEGRGDGDTQQRRHDPADGEADVRSIKLDLEGLRREEVEDDELELCLVLEYGDGQDGRAQERRPDDEGIADAQDHLNADGAGCPPARPGRSLDADIIEEPPISTLGLWRSLVGLGFGRCADDVVLDIADASMLGSALDEQAAIECDCGADEESLGYGREDEDQADEARHHVPLVHGSPVDAAVCEL